jgi:hypothetical protein
MAKLLQLSVLIAIIAIPARAARDPNPARGLRKALIHTIYFNLFYLFIIMFVYGRLAS